MTITVEQLDKANLALGETMNKEECAAIAKVLCESKVFQASLGISKGLLAIGGVDMLLGCLGLSMQAAFLIGYNLGQAAALESLVGKEG